MSEHTDFPQQSVKINPPASKNRNLVWIPVGKLVPGDRICLNPPCGPLSEIVAIKYREYPKVAIEYTTGETHGWMLVHREDGFHVEQCEGRAS